jgi:hypothetical protein
MDEQQRRKARNESLFRDVNERIEEVHQTLGSFDQAEFVCECDDALCTDRFEMSLPEYERLRADPLTFAVMPGHESPEVEDVVGEGDGYRIVRKHSGEPARIAAEDAPR